MVAITFRFDEVFGQLSSGDLIFLRINSGPFGVIFLTFLKKTPGKVSVQSSVFRKNDFGISNKRLKMFWSLEFIILILFVI